MIRVHVLAGFFLFVSMNNMIVSSLKPEDRVIRMYSISAGQVKECANYIYYFTPSNSKYWDYHGHDNYRFTIDPRTGKIRVIEAVVNENGLRVVDTFFQSDALEKIVERIKSEMKKGRFLLCEVGAK